VSEVVDIGDLADDLSAQIQRAEDTVRALGFRVRATTSMGRGKQLAFGKFSGGWGLRILDDGKETDVLSASMGDRVVIAHALPALVEELRKTQEHSKASVRDATSHLSAFLDKLESEAAR
jgi:hypothetical protein